MKIKEKIELILELDSSPLGGSSSESGSGFLIETESGTNKTGFNSKPNLEPEPLFKNGSGFGSTMVPIRDNPVCNPK